MTIKEFLKMMAEAYIRSCTYIFGAYAIATVVGVVFKGLRRNPLHK